MVDKATPRAPGERVKWWMVAGAVVVALVAIGMLVPDPPAEEVGVAAQPNSAAETRAAVPKAVTQEAAFRPLSGPNVFTVIFPEAMPPDEMRAQAKEHCGAREFCSVLGWTSSVEAAGALPMTDRELETQAFAFTLNRTTGNDEARWDCRRFPRDAEDECLAK